MGYERTNPESMKLCRVVEDVEDPTCLPDDLACIHPVLFNWGLHFPLLCLLAQFCVFLSIPIGQLSANCLWILTCLHVIWCVSGCEYLMPYKVLQLHTPRLGTCKGHQLVVELKEKINSKSCVQCPLLRVWLLTR